MPDWTTVESPEGFSWSQRPHYGDIGTLTMDSPNLTVTDTRMEWARYLQEAGDRLIAWADENRCTVRPHAYTSIPSLDLPRVTVIYVYPQGQFDEEVPETPEETQRRRREIERYFGTRTCRHGTDHGLVVQAYICECAGVAEILPCETSGCRRPVSTFHWVDGSYYCNSHAHACAWSMPEGPCNRVYIRQPNSLGYMPSYCDEHDPAVECVGCWVENWQTQSGTVNLAGETVNVCYACMENLCQECSSTFDTRWSDRFGSYICEPCRARLLEGENEQFQEIEEQPNTLLTLEAHPLRPVRTCSIELETTDGGYALARALSGVGLTNYSSVADYHHGNRAAPGSFCYVERDSSIGEEGGELIIDRVNLDQPEESAKLRQALSVMRELVRNGTIGVNIRCGTHITVDGHRYGIGDVRNLVLITNYIEDVIYRLSSANYRYHRGTRYAQPVDKGPFSTDAEFGIRFFADNGHRSALNVSSYWAAVRNNCQCGASLVGRHAECGCNLGKCAFEFRYFNGTSNPRTLHAWVALCQSLVSFAKAAPDLRAEDYTPMEYLHNPNQTDFDRFLAQWDERLRWVFKNLWFGEAEKESLIYTIEHCSLSQLGEDRLRDIYATPFDPPAELALDQQIVKLDRSGTVNRPASESPVFRSSLQDISAAAQNVWTTVQPDPIDLDLDDFVE